MSEHTPNSAKIISGLHDAIATLEKQYQRALAERDAEVAALEQAILGYLATFDRCGGSESVSADEFAERRQRMRDLVGRTSDSGSAG